MVIALKNDQIQLTVRPDLGGRIDQLRDLQTNRDWLWHSSGYDPSQTRSLNLGDSFDQHWTGGWDEVFPNDAAGSFQGHSLVDHGELWSQAWEVVEAAADRVQLTYTCQTVPVRIEKTIRLHETEPEAEVEYLLQNQSDETLPFLLKQHAAIAIEPGDEIILPDCLIEPVDLGFSKIIGRQEKTHFPTAFNAEGKPIQVQYAPPRSSQLQEFYYSSELSVGQCGIYHGKSRSALLMQFDLADFPYVWMFQSYGGWRDHYVVVVEPCTTMPYDLAIACQNGTAAQLQPQQTQRRRLTVRLQQFPSTPPEA